LVTASEVGSYVYCPEAWRLEFGLGLRAGNQPVRTAGERHHGEKLVAERIAGASIGLGRLLLIIAAIMLVALVLWLRWR
jgi:hypothetical protein